MKKLKYLFWIILVLFFGLLVYQNLAFFAAKHILELNLGIYYYSTPQLTAGAIIAIFVGISILIMMPFYLASRYENYRSKKTIKELKNGMEESTKAVSSLKDEVDLIKNGTAAPPDAVSTEKTEPGDKKNETSETTADQTTRI